MHADLFDSLLGKVESDSLDFKSEQYHFAGRNDYEKSELLKDIIAFANGRRNCDAHILIGVAEKSPPPNQMVGITEHLKDNDIQQFVNQKTNRPVTFRVEAFVKDGKEFDVITIPAQHGPFFLLKDFGKLRQNITYIRRGTTCAEASPEEVVKLSTPTRNLKLNINPTRKGKQQLAHIRLFNAGPGAIFIESWWVQWGPGGSKGLNRSIKTVSGKLPVRIEEQNFAELVVEIDGQIEDLSGIGAFDGDHHPWQIGAHELEILKHQAIAHRLPPLMNDDKDAQEKEKETAAIKDCKIEIEARATLIPKGKRLEVVFKNKGDVSIPLAGARLSWTYTPPRPSPSQPGKPQVAEAGGKVGLNPQFRAASVDPGKEVLFVLDDDMSPFLIELLRGDVRDEDITIEIGTTKGVAWGGTMDEIPGAVREVAQSALERMHRESA